MGRIMQEKHTEKKENFSGIKDPVSGFTHLFGAILAIPITIYLGTSAAKKLGWIDVIGFVIFGISMFLLYTASTVYHLSPATGKKGKILRTVDHMMIFVFIAGTYTPLCLTVLKDKLGFGLLFFVWLVALIGIVIKIFFLQAPRWISTGIYVGMGWLALFIIIPLYKSLPTGGFILLVLGGVIYTMGALIYACKWPPISSKYVGFHELFHMFVLGGSFFHVLLMTKYVLYM